MMNLLRRTRYFLEYAGAKCLYWLIKLSPHPFIKIISTAAGKLVYLCFKKLINANIRIAFPEKNDAEVEQIGTASAYNVIFNMLEFIWLNNNPSRIEKVLKIAPDVIEKIQELSKSGTRIIFVNPHIGSWEASGLMAPYYGGIKMAAIAKPLRNPYLNRLLNEGNREKERGLKIIFAKGAVKAAIKALRSGASLGTLIDQNTRVRNGGVFVDFFGMPVPTSKAPVLLARYCESNNIKARIVYASSLRQPDGTIKPCMEFLSKDLDSYQSDKEIIRELMAKSEKYIRQYPEQYLWLYHRFRYIPRDCSEDVRRRFPYYASVASSKFYAKTGRLKDIDYTKAERVAVVD
ncbi:hypothetical protein P0136_00120 [Lentisphaerota bacterium ZTH]|nr:hypothetical protein JYG24_08735 [Lentisphaerota bacterium]WET06422.1 hypothetical protein P0136_00120 [Lentisphaerota bacterium ZTH]